MVDLFVDEQRCARRPPPPPPPGPPEKRLRRARRPVSSADSASARKTAQNAPLGSFGGQFRGHFWARAVQASNASSNFAFSRIGELRKAPESSKELWGAPESLGLINLLYLLCLRAGRCAHVALLAFKRFAAVCSGLQPFPARPPPPTAPAPTHMSYSYMYYFDMS